MDPRFQYAPILDRRKEEWNDNKVKENIDRLFYCIDMVENYQFIKSEWKIEPRIRKEELKRNIIKTLVIMLRDPKEKEFTYELKVPELIMDQFFYIGGYLKIPLFQLFDHPILYTKPNQIKLRTNILTLNAKRPKDNEVEEFVVNLFNRKIPLHQLIACYHNKGELDNFFNKINTSNNYLLSVRTKCEDIWNNNQQENLIKEIGKKFSTVKNDEEKKGRSILFSLKVANELDFFSRRYMKTDSILFELLNTIHQGTRSDTDIQRKRIRFSEYVLAPLVRKIYDMIITLYNTRKSINFKIPKNIILEKCNVSDESTTSIVHFNLSTNPTSELATLFQAILTGPGGFKKENVPNHLRTLDESQFGYICAADTPDRDGCGVVQNMVPVIKLDKYGNFGKANKKIITSYPISLTPFLRNDDQTRLQMASNQIKQTILLKNSEKPMIKSGTEDAYLSKGTFLYSAKDDGEVIHLNSDCMIVIYKDGSGEVFKPYYRMILMDYLKPRKIEGEKFRKGEILAESKFLKNGELSLGQNLLCGLMIYKGWNYEDAIVISDEVSNKKFTSLHDIDLSFELEPHQCLLSLNNEEYESLPKIGQTLKKGDVYCRIKVINPGADLELINIEPLEKTVPRDCKIVSIEVYPNYWNKDIEENHNLIETYIAKQTKRFEEILEKITKYLGPSECEKFLDINGLARLDSKNKIGKYYYEGKKVKGVLFKIKAIYEEKIGTGDKIANRHGNKGVIGKIIPKEKMPTLPDGRKMDIVINPLGIISRMNVGQLYELHLSECLYQLKKKLHTSKNPEKYLLGFLKLVDNKTKDRWIQKKLYNEFKDNKKSLSLEEAISRLYIIQPAFQSIEPEDLIQIMVYVGLLTSRITIPKDSSLEEKLLICLKHISDKYKIYDPIAESEINNLIACGYMYFEKLVHRASDKMSARSIGPYSKKTLQPLGGKSSHGAHRLGEMEVWSLMAYNSKELLKSLLTTHSDSSVKKNELLAKILENPDLIDEEDNDRKPESLSILEGNLRVIGINLNM